MNPNRKNLANGILALGVSTSDTTWVLESGYGGAMPAVPFFLTITPFGQLSTMGNSEIVNVTARSGDTLTVQRSQKGTTARAFAAGSVVSNGIYVEDKVGSANIDFATFGSGESSDFTVSGFSTIYAKRLTWMRVGNFVTLSIFVDGVSNSNSKSVTLPYTNVGMDSGLVIAYTRDNGGNNIGLASMSNNSSTITFLKNTIGDPFTSSGSCRVATSLTLKVA